MAKDVHIYNREFARGRDAQGRVDAHYRRLLRKMGRPPTNAEVEAALSRARSRRHKRLITYVARLASIDKKTCRVRLRRLGFKPRRDYVDMSDAEIEAFAGDIRQQLKDLGLG